MTLAQAKWAIEAQLSQTLLDPEVSVDVFAYNSKYYYIVTDGAGYGEQYRLPSTGNETVLDAISQINGLPSLPPSAHLVARPAPADATCYQILPVDWKAMTRGGATNTNYQLLPGDRLFVQAEPIIAVDTYLARFIAPFERMLGITLLGNSVVEAVCPASREDSAEAFNGDDRDGGLYLTGGTIHLGWSGVLPQEPRTQEAKRKGIGHEAVVHRGPGGSRLRPLLAVPAHAQFPPGPAGFRTPPFSPYLNLNRRGTNPAINYYGLVRPQIEFRNAIQNLQSDVSSLGAQAASGQAGVTTLPPTGHPTQFSNLSGYFPLSATARGGARASGLPGGFAPQGATPPAGMPVRR
jgi:hypothetical protein